MSSALATGAPEAGTGAGGERAAGTPGHRAPGYPVPAAARPPAALTARARITAEPDGRGGTTLPVLAGAGPLAPRRTRGEGRTAHVVIVGSMAAPLGGDRLAVTVDVRAGAALRVTSAAATISLPGPGPAHYEVDLTVGEGARLDWLPEQVVAATGSHLVTHTRITLAAGAELHYREEQILGRHHDWARGNPPGRLTSRLTVRRAGRLLLDQQTDLGPGAPGWDGPAVLATYRTAGQVLTVAPDGGAGPVRPPTDDSALLVLPGVAHPGAARLLTAVAPDALALRRALGG
ncbi:urease accessory protein UreD [Kitasatospora sp. NPDC057015]|uniref:urease accessory protein UreD n=1 Tax=Kitasatospora sp. NPDC057015 TaxID=3346001 RepID=UPI00362F83A2